jgi:AraC-like DNA-binding protein
MELNLHDICVLASGHMAKVNEVSDDCRVRIVVLSEAFSNKIKYLNVSHYDKHFNHSVTHPVCHLSDECYSPVSDAFNVLQAINDMCKENREAMLLNVFQTIIMMRYEFYPIDTESNKEKDTRISTRFQEAVIKHYRESRSVDFYAKMFGLSAKYFAALIKEEIYVSPGRWIGRYVTARAKDMLDKRGDLNIQQIAFELGFDEQSSFSRFFKGQVGMTPKEYRKNKEAQEGE